MKILLAIVGSLIVLYLCWMIVGTYLIVRAQPREPMEWCPKHGPIRKEHMITFAGTPYCSICFHERMKTAENIIGRPNGR
jgi:hypothetical protein